LGNLWTSQARAARASIGVGLILISYNLIAALPLTSAIVSPFSVQLLWRFRGGQTLADV
jgi:hypothetical protein